MNKQISRRDFLKGAAASAVVGVAALSLGGCSSGSSSATATPAPTEAGGLYIPGTYTATATGMGDVTVTMTFDANSITDVVLDLSAETDNIGQAAGATLIEQIMGAQSSEIDGVSGASLTSGAVKSAAANCIAQAKGEIAAEVAAAAATGMKEVVDWLGAEPEIADSDISETLETEVLIVGAGTGGMFAACSAGEQGAKTLVIDRFESGGGIRDDLGAVDSRYQLEWGTKIDKFDYITMLTKSASGHVDQRLIKLFCDESAETINWYGDLLAERGVTLWHEAGGDDPDDRYEHFATGHTPRWADSDDGSGNKLNGNTVLCDYAAGLGVEFRYKARMIKLVKESGKVTGVIAQDTETNEYIKINATKGTVVCTGGYARNLDMVEVLQPHSFTCSANNQAIPGTTGDGIKACVWAGAKFEDTHSMMTFDRIALKPDQVPGRALIESGEETGFFWMGSQPWLKVNSEGERFFNESGTYAGILSADEYNKDHCHYTLFDSDWPAYAEAFKMHGCSRLYPFPNGADPNIPWQAIAGMLAGLVESGFVFQCDTIAELAEKLGLPEDALQTTVDRYNELYDMGVDEDFGKEPNRLSALRTAPFYGAKNTGFFLCTMDGIQINTDMQAVGTDNSPIPGLYVVGNDSGGYFSGIYPSIATGAAAGRTITFGRRAGRIAANL
ncbi:MAG: FAD-binding protein [Clostridia bacterium]|nr:FAD-binding protein [Clostridia bacterium]